MSSVAMSPDRTATTVDPVDYAVITQALLAAAREMGIKLVRSAYSTIVREASDASAALLDRHGNVVAQAELIPMQLGPMADTFRACAKRFPVHSLREGDFYINNNPFDGGQHLPDVFIYSPIFFGGEVIAFASTVAHHLDLGGGNPGLTTEAADVHAEGIIFPPSKYNLHEDWSGGPLERLVSANVRVPQQTIGDFNAQFAANAIGAQRLHELCEKYGVARICMVMNQLLDYSEARFRAALRAVPDGTYFGEDAVDDDGLSDTPLLVKTRVTVSGDDIHVDFAGTCAQVTRNLNCPFSSTVSATLSAIKSTLSSPDIPFNEGVKRPVHIQAPLGSLLNPRYPAPVRARMEASYRCFNAVMKALSAVVPEAVIAGGSDSTTVLALSHLEESGYRVYLEVFGGGYGASSHADGCDAVDAPLSNCANTPIEATDMDFRHFRITGYGLIADSCGHGKYRGGLGFFRRYEVLEDAVNFAIYADRFRIAPFGLFGGGDGSPARCFVQRASERISVKSKDGLQLQKGDILTLVTPGGGGYGPPDERSVASIKRDISNQYISSRAAQRLYPQWSPAGP